MLVKDLLLHSKDITVISNYSSVPGDLSVNYLLNLFNKKFDNTRIDSLVSLLDFHNFPRKELVKKLSDGQKQKLKILAFLLDDKPIVILDEVTTSLDKKTVDEIYIFFNNFIKQFPDKTVLNITHNVSDLKKVKGNYYIFEERNIVRVDNVDNAIVKYIEG